MSNQNTEINREEFYGTSSARVTFKPSPMLNEALSQFVLSPFQKAYEPKLFSERSVKISLADKIETDHPDVYDQDEEYKQLTKYNNRYLKKVKSDQRLGLMAFTAQRLDPDAPNILIGLEIHAEIKPGSTASLKLGQLGLFHKGARAFPIMTTFPKRQLDQQNIAANLSNLNDIVSHFVTLSPLYVHSPQLEVGRDWVELSDFLDS